MGVSRSGVGCSWCCEWQGRKDRAPGFEPDGLLIRPAFRRAEASRVSGAMRGVGYHFPAGGRSGFNCPLPLRAPLRVLCRKSLFHVRGKGRIRGWRENV